MAFSHVVGYQETTLENETGYSFVTPTFKVVGNGEAEYDLQSIKLVGEYVGDGATDYIEIWNDAGCMTDKAYYYVNEANGYEKDGWVTEMFGSEYVSNETLPLGVGFYLVTGSGDVKVQYAGEVVQGDVTTDALPQGYNVIGNATPVPVNLQSIKLLGEFVGDGATDYIEVWNDAGCMTDKAYYYVNEANGYEKDGWVTEMFGSEYPTDIVYEPGQGFFLIVGSGDDVQVQMPGAL